MFSIWIILQLKILEKMNQQTLSIYGLLIVLDLWSQIRLSPFCVVIVSFEMVMKKMLMLAMLKSFLWRQTIWEETLMQNVVSNLHYGRRGCVGSTYLKQCKWKPCGNAGLSVLPAWAISWDLTWLKMCTFGAGNRGGTGRQEVTKSIKIFTCPFLAVLRKSAFVFQ